MNERLHKALGPWRSEAWPCMAAPNKSAGNWIQATAEPARFDTLKVHPVSSVLDIVQTSAYSAFCGRVAQNGKHQIIGAGGQDVSNFIKKRENAEKVGAGLRALGWTPTIGTLSSVEGVRGYTVGVIVPVGDERFEWRAVKQDPLLTFFSIANIASGAAKNLARKPVGFSSSVAGIDHVQIHPNKDESMGSFIRRLTQAAPQMMLGFDFDPVEAHQEQVKKIRKGMGARA